MGLRQPDNLSQNKQQDHNIALDDGSWQQEILVLLFINNIYNRVNLDSRIKVDLSLPTEHRFP